MTALSKIYKHPKAPAWQISAQAFNQLLQEVEKPARYLGNEVNSIHKNPEEIQLNVALAFPDAYEIGESHVGLKILYKILNEQKHLWAQRVYAPLPDMEAALMQHKVPLFSLENHMPLKHFDLIGITLPYELVYTNILTILDRGEIPVWQKDRRKEDPIILGGGNSAFNPEPVAEFFDAIVVGDGEELILPIAEKVLHYRQSDQSRDQLLQELAQLEGVYVPSLFEIKYFSDGKIEKIIPKLENYSGVKKATVANLDQAAYPLAPIVPNINVIHDRIGVEVQRGCVRGCRFCQAGYIYRPERQRSPDTVKNIISQSLQNTGLEEVSLLSLSVGDYEPISPLLNDLFDEYEKDCVAISLPATRTETLTPEVIQQIKRVRKTGFTIAPEAGTPRMRRIINKGNERSDLMQTVENVFKEGWRLIKFYYMCGLPLENEEDLLGIAEEAKMALAIGKKYTHAPQINVSVSSFVPKPFTPFQWEPQPSIEEISEKHRMLARALKQKGLQFKYHGVEMSYLEGVFSRGDRRLSQTLWQAYQLGSRFDEWQEHLKFDLWEEAFKQTGIDPDFYVTRQRDKEEILPWDHLFVQMKKDFLWKEWEAAREIAFIEDCSTGKCTYCGVCDFHEIKNINYQYSREDKTVEAHSTRRRPLKEEKKQSLGQSADLMSEKTLAKRDLKPIIKIRARYSKIGEAAYIGHLDLMQLLRRAIARAKIPVGFSQGFNPHVRMSMGPAQSLGMESIAEFVDLELTQMIDAEDFRERMNRVLAQGIQILEAWVIDLKTPSINQSIAETCYDIELSQEEFLNGHPDLKDQVLAFLKSQELKLTRYHPKKNRVLDIRPLVKELEALPPNRLRLVTKYQDGQANVRPSEVLDMLFQQIKTPNNRIRKVEARFS
ncbi:MAG: TIGR03960 family B12-binding radical SAM protein [Deltaproteobacteria bacterium]|nr:TIGR03960 family B12-binding radical SAM protein [Deltaproteobacteria bacterium]